MATSSITANFHTDDPKAANAIVHALFTVSSVLTLPTYCGLKAEEATTIAEMIKEIVK